MVAAYIYYQEKLLGLGERFLSALLHRYQQLSEQPTLNGFIAEDLQQTLRDVRLERFPYVVGYEVIEMEVIVYAVHNTYTNPGNKLRKV